MSEEYIPTGHRIFRGGKRIENEVVATELKPFVIHQPGDEDEDDAAEDVKKRKPSEAVDEEDMEEADEAQADSGSPEDIAARIAGDRAQFQADILAVARAEAGEDDEGNPLPDEAEEEQEESE